MFAEVIYETGSKAVVSGDTEEEIMGGVQAHHDRAKAGQLGGPTGHPAERVVEVLFYDEHPGDYRASQMLSVAEVEKELAAAIKNLAVGDQVSVPELTNAVVRLTTPIIDREDMEPHKSMFKAKETKKVGVK